MADMVLTDEMQKAYDLIERTQQSVFISLVRLELERPRS